MRGLMLFLLILQYHLCISQIGNYVNNGSFEEYYTCSGPFYPINTAKHWMSVDSSGYGGVYCNICNSKVPINGSGFQYPSTGNAYILSTQFCVNPSCARGYLKNRLKATLEAGTKYCVKFSISIANESPRAMDGFGIYFGDSSLDTITHYDIPLSYITPQVKNPPGNIISDTLNWTVVSGTFVATGTEKNLLLGNFLEDNAVATSSINSPSFPQNWTDVYFDDVSCIEMDLPAYAGPDKSIIPDDSTYIGRQPDFAIDPGCIWYKLPDMTTAIDTISGLWVKPTETTTYVVRQELDCSSVKWDTVVVHINGVGLEKFQFISQKLEVYPVPAKDYFELKIPESYQNDFNRMTLHNSFGQLIREEDINFRSGSAYIGTEDISEGIYTISVTNSNNERIVKKLLIAK